MNKFNFGESVAISVSAFDSIIKYNQEKNVPFGISFLDDLFGGIMPDDLFLIGAASGVGKTQLAMTIAAEASRTKNVIMFALEASENEIMMRLLYRKFFKWYKDSSFYKKDEYISFDLFLMGKPAHLVNKFRESTDFHLNEFENLEIRYFESGFTITDLERTLIESKAAGFELIVIDHLHYFDMLTDNEYKETKQILKSIQEFIRNELVPVILVSHVRKADERNPKLTPSGDDFHGTSDIIKIVTKAVMIGLVGNIPVGELVCKTYKNKSGEEVEVEEFIPESFEMFGGTFVRAVKNRKNGMVTGVTLRVQYDSSACGYSLRYNIGRPYFDKGKLCFLKFKQNEFPKWAEYAKE